MFATKPLSSFKNALPSIHQPLPLSSRESKKLLNALKTSFRQNLDKEHGWAPENAESSAETSSQQPSSSHDSHRRPTDRHLRSILSNPLFKSAVKPEDVAFAAPRDPMQVFDEAVSKGMMTRMAATGCLRTKRQQILQSSALSAQEAMSASMSGLRVLQWLRSSGEERTLEFLADSKFVHELMPFLVAEGLEEVAWVWADRMVRGEGPAGENGRIVGRVIAQLVGAKSDIEDKNLDSAFAAMLRADETWKSDPQLPLILLRPWSILSWRSTVEAWKRPLPSTQVFESFVGTANHMRNPLTVDRAHLELHHPTRPNHMQAVKWLRRLEGGQQAKPMAMANNRLIPRAMFMGMDAVSHLTRLGRTDEAEALLRTLQSMFSEDLWQRHRTHGMALV